ncbi:MAG: ribonuclease HII [Chitinophagales bacterium]
MAFFALFCCKGKKVLKKFFQKGLIEAGCDEAGRGCLAGPVFAASVILPPGFRHPLLNDSKQVAEEDRNKLRPVIERKAVAWAVAMVDHTEIDRINILKASFKAMHLAIDQLQTRPDLLLIDGHIFSPYFGIVHQCVVQGDAIYASIAAASILAKTHRDEYMIHLHREYPQYGWNENKGYGTPYHRQQIIERGLSPYHRKTFGICNEWTEEDEMSAGN